jgi:hypothetical protein
MMNSGVNQGDGLHASLAYRFFGDTSLSLDDQVAFLYGRTRIFHLRIL